MNGVRAHVRMKGLSPAQVHDFQSYLHDCNFPLASRAERISLVVRSYDEDFSEKREEAAGTVPRTSSASELRSAFTTERTAQYTK